MNRAALLLALSPGACLLIGRAIRVREVERPVVEPVAPGELAQEARAEPVPDAASSARTADERSKIPA